MTIEENQQARSSFFFWMSLLLLGIVIAGFLPSFFLRSVSDLKALPGHLHLHGTILAAWYVWLVVQTSAIRRGRLTLHRQLGMVGAAIGAACVVAAPLATLGLVESLQARGLDWDSDMSGIPELGIEGITMELFAARLVFGNIATVLTFATLLVLAILLRKKAAAHKRLMLVASICIIGPALARISRWPGFGGEDGPFIPIAIIALLIAMFVHDYMTTKRVHHATWIGAVAINVTFAISQAIGSSDLGSTIVRAME